MAMLCQCDNVIMNMLRLFIIEKKKEEVLVMSMIVY